MINTTQQALLTRINENGLQNQQQTRQLAENRLADNRQAEVQDVQRVDNKARVDLATPNESALLENRTQPTSRLTSSRSSESDQIYEQYNETGRRGSPGLPTGQLIDIQV